MNKHENKQEIKNNFFGNLFLISCWFSCLFAAFWKFEILLLSFGSRIKIFFKHSCSCGYPCPTRIANVLHIAKRGSRNNYFVKVAITCSYRMYHINKLHQSLKGKVQRLSLHCLILGYLRLRNNNCAVRTSSPLIRAILFRERHALCLFCFKPSDWY